MTKEPNYIDSCVPFSDEINRAIKYNHERSPNIKYAELHFDIEKDNSIERRRLVVIDSQNNKTISGRDLDKDSYRKFTIDKIKNLQIHIE